MINTGSSWFPSLSGPSKVNLQMDYTGVPGCKTSCQLLWLEAIVSRLLALVIYTVNC